MIIQSLQKICDDNKDKDLFYVRNLMKESLQYYILNYIYNSKYGQSFTFTGGTCLRFCFDLPRLSEDLDFNTNLDDFSFETFKEDLYEYFSSKLQFKDIDIQIKGSNNLIYVNFPILDKVGYPVKKPSDKTIFIRLDISSDAGGKYKTEISLRSSPNFSFLIKHYSLENLFSGKLSAILERKTKNNGKTVPRFKGRDYYDLFWYIDKEVKPNFDYIFSATSYTDKSAVINSLIEKINKAIEKKRVLKNDLYPFFENQEFVDIFVDNLDTLKDKIKRLA